MTEERGPICDSNKNIEVMEGDFAELITGEVSDKAKRALIKTMVFQLQGSFLYISPEEARELVKAGAVTIYNDMHPDKYTCSATQKTCDMLKEILHDALYVLDLEGEE